jgi:flagellar hook-associated protein 1 FlgK
VSFFGLNLAARGLAAQQNAMNVVGQNISNASTAGYHRQKATISSLSVAGSNGQRAMGAGSDVTDVQRMQNQFLDAQLMGSGQNLGRWSAGKDALDQVVALINEPSDTGLSSDMSKFWAGWQDLALHPDSASSRNNVLQAGTTLAGSFNRIASGLRGVQTQQDSAIAANVDQVNRLAAKLASLNNDITQSSISGQAPNDLLDQRGTVLTELSNLVDVRVQGNGGAGDTITLGGRSLVQGSQSFALSAGQDANGHTTVLWKEDGSAAKIAGGEIGGEIDIQQNVIPAYMAKLDEVAVALRDRVNAVHSAGSGQDGTTGTNFFVGTDAASLAVNPALLADPRLLASGATSAAGDGTVAKAIAAIKSEALVSGSTLGEAYGSFASLAGTHAVAMQDKLDAESQLSAQLTVQQQSVSGVNLDEEMTDMIRFQQAYNASARVLTTMDEMISTLINNYGAR